MSKKPHPDSNTVLFFVKPRFISHRERISGVYAAAIRRGWQVHLIEEAPSAERLRTYVKLLRPMGCLVDLSTFSETIDARIYRKLPTVLIGRDPTRKRQILDCSCQNSSEPVRLAVDVLSGLGLTDFAFIGDPARPYWSVERGELFKKALPQNARSTGFDLPVDTIEGHRAMKAWLRSLPKPCGCFLAADHLAFSFYSVAAEAGLKIGIDLPVISVDDDEQRCLSLTPHLTSIKLDFFLAGENAVTLLEKRLAEPDNPPQTMTYGALGVIRRGSTNPIFPDMRVTKGMMFITKHGCENISVEDVAGTMGCCGRLAEKLFRKHAEMSILDAIRKTRMDKVFCLLKNRAVPIDAIPFQCGYAASPAYLKTFFKKQTGMTMREWRRKTASPGSGM